MRNLSGKRALVTGGAQGIGRAIAVSLTKRGAEIVLSDLNADALEATASELAASGLRVSTYVLDVTDTVAVREIRDCIVRERGPIDILVNNAGTVFGGSFLDVPLEKHLLTYRVNTLGLVAVTHAFLPDLISRPEANLVNIASISGFVGLPYGTTYASSKWAVIGLSEGLRLELKELGHRHVAVTAVCPSYVKTGLFDGVKLPTNTNWLTPERLAEKIVRGIERNKPYVLAPWQAHLTPILKGVLPMSVMDWVGRYYGINTTMSSWRGHGAPATATAQPSEAANPTRDRAPVA